MKNKFFIPFFIFILVLPTCVIPQATAATNILETITVPSDGTSVTSHTILANGVTYQIEASGEMSIGGPTADAEYAYAKNLPIDPGGSWWYSAVTNSCGTSGIDLGIGIDDTENDNSKFPNWGTFTETHIYTINFVGKGAAIKLNYHDCLYDDNFGSLVVKIYGPNTPPPTTGSTTPTTGPTTTTSIQLPPIKITPPGAPTDLTATLTSSNTIDLSWNPPENNGGSNNLSYKIEVKTGAHSSYQNISNEYSQTSYSYTNSFTPGTTYTFRVFAINEAGTSPPSNEVPVTITSSPQIKIVSVTPSDQQGNPVTSFTKGQIGYVKVVVSSSSGVSALVSVNLFGPDSTSLGIGSVKSTVNGDATMVISFFVPSRAQSGIANIYTDGLSDWPSQGGVPLSPENQATVNVG